MLNNTELALMRQQNDGPTIILIIITACAFGIGILFEHIRLD
jgi:hypothetical protein